MKRSLQTRRIFTRLAPELMPDATVTRTGAGAETGWTTAGNRNGGVPTAADTATLGPGSTAITMATGGFMTTIGTLDFAEDAPAATFTVGQGTLDFRKTSAAGTASIRVDGLGALVFAAVSARAA